ncbi:ARM repeat-containing protein [Macrolepiota fuliginosa MF-IS2]|uniref:Importin-13 n=1 Tax=Macrolepiota fuliginosa MF-IS2 TaxID=1400762 RepID=A0A9P6BXY4_9AGAR|nr:ARM repeat-containing protein [Macrolepiota fuliginosa MF-IS2]
MIDTSFLPSLQQSDIHQAIQLILQAYASPSSLASPDDLKRLQHELFEIQKRPEAWGLVIPLLEHADQNVQFFGAHTAQVKIARDWEFFPKERAEALRDLMIQLTAHAVAIGRGKFILRKLFVALTSLALKLVPGHPTRWPNWIMGCVTMFSGRGAPTEHIHDFLAIVAEEVPDADLLGPSKAQMSQSLMDAVPMVAQAITSSILSTSPPSHIQSALRCLQAWMTIFPTSDLTPIIPMLISLLNPPDEDIFISASDTLQEILSKSALSDGSGTRTLTEPLLFWLDRVGTVIVREVVSSGDVSPVARSTCKLIVALGDHSTQYLATNVASRIVTSINVPPSLQVEMQPSPMHPQGQRAQIAKSHLVHSFLRLMLAFTGLPGYFGVDEDESEMTLGFWYLFQEALWATDYHTEDGEGDVGEFAEPIVSGDAREKEQVRVAKAVYIELVQVLRRKVMFPPSGSGWSKDQVDKFQVYRRDVGDTLINAYYVLREDMLGYYINDLVQRLNAKREEDGWQEMEATLHCVMSIQEAIDLTENSPHLPRLFGPEVLGRLPQTGQPRVRRTMLGVIGAYSSWFANLPNLSRPASSSATPAMTPTSTPIALPSFAESSQQSFQSQVQQPTQRQTQAQALLLSALSYVVNALPNQALCLQAGVALRNLCDANRKALAPHIAAFGELHGGLGSVPDSEKGKVLQSIASVVQALPPEQEIPPLEAIVNPIVQKLAEALQSAASLPDEARALAILQLEILSGVAKGLTHTTEGLIEGELEPTELEKINVARGDVRMAKLREAVFGVVRSVVEIWSADAGVGHALSDLFKSITSLPTDITLISLPAGPLLELVCMAIQRQVTAAWISLATILIAQLNPPVFALSLKPGPKPEAEAVVREALPVLLRAALGMMGMAGAMESNPDIVQEFFVCMDRVAQDFTPQFYQLPEGALDALMQCAITALSLQERYSLVAASNFLSSLIHRSALTDELMPHKCALVARHGRPLMRAVLQGFAGVAPRSVVPNLIEVLGTLMSRAGTRVETNDSGTASEWMKDVIYAPDFILSKATMEDKEKFVKGIVGSRSLRKTRDAANQFTLVARGLEGSNFGYASVTM